MFINWCKDINLAANLWKTEYMGIGYHWGLEATQHINILTISSNFCYFLYLLMQIEILRL